VNPEVQWDQVSPGDLWVLWNRPLWGQDYQVNPEALWNQVNPEAHLNLWDQVNPEALWDQVNPESPGGQ